MRAVAGARRHRRTLAAVGDSERMLYEERDLPDELAGIVSRVWFLEMPRVRRFEKILPLPFAHLIVNLSEPYRLHTREGEETIVPSAFISGLQSDYLVIESPPRIRHVGVEFTPVGLSAFAPDSAAALAGRVADARGVFGDAEALIGQLEVEAAPAEALETLTAWLAAGRVADVDVVARRAAETLTASPSTPISALAEDAGISHKNLIAHFTAATGTTPKRYAQVVRFHRFIAAVADDPGRPDWSRRAVESGYFDQPHVIRAFRRFAGWTPTEYRRLVEEHGAAAAFFVPMTELPLHASS